MGRSFHELPEERVSVSVNVSTTSTINDILDFDKYSSYSRILRITAWILRFKNNLKARMRNEPIEQRNILQPLELCEAETILIRGNQN